MKLITFISAGAFIFLSAFAMKKNATTSIYGTKWLLQKIHSDTGVQTVQTKAFIKFDEAKNSAGGNGSCNGFGSNTTINGNIVSFKNIFSTKMFCEEVQKTEDVYLGNLGKINRFEIKGKTLLLYNDKKVLLEFIVE